MWNSGAYLRLGFLIYKDEGQDHQQQPEARTLTWDHLDHHSAALQVTRMLICTKVLKHTSFWFFRFWFQGNSSGSVYLLKTISRKSHVNCRHWSTANMATIYHLTSQMGPSIAIWWGLMTFYWTSAEDTLLPVNALCKHCEEKTAIPRTFPILLLPPPHRENRSHGSESPKNTLVPSLSSPVLLSQLFCSFKLWSLQNKPLLTCEGLVVWSASEVSSINYRQPQWQFLLSFFLLMH